MSIQFQSVSTTFTDRNNSEITVESNLFLAREAIGLATQLGKMVLPFGKAFAGIQKKAGLTDGNIEDVLKNTEITPDFFKIIVDQLISSIDEKRINDLIFRLLKGTRVNGQEISKPEIYDIVFQGNLSLLVKVLQFIITSNYADFFDMPVVVALKERFTALASRK